jgi:hypothetical protein
LYFRLFCLDYYVYSYGFVLSTLSLYTSLLLSLVICFGPWTLTFWWYPLPCGYVLLLYSSNLLSPFCRLLSLYYTSYSVRCFFPWVLVCTIFIDVSKFPTCFDTLQVTSRNPLSSHQRYTCILTELQCAFYDGYWEDCLMIAFVMCQNMLEIC